MNKIKKIFSSNFIKNNWIILCFVIISIFTELVGVAVTAHKFYIRSPFVSLSILLLCVVVLFFIRSQFSRFIVAIILLGGQGLLNIGFIVVYEMTGQIFDYTMLELRQDAWGILESVPINIEFFFSFGIVYSSFIVFGSRFIKRKELLPKLSKFGIQLSACLVASAAIVVASVSSSITYIDFYNELLYSEDDNSYNDMGITGNVVSQLTAGATKKPVNMGDASDIANFIFDSDQIQQSNFRSNYSKNYNVVTVLCESFEWMAIMQDLDRYPLGINFSDPTDPSREGTTIAREVFPNLYEFYDNSLVFDNFHSKEKTDISENYSYLGAYPTNAITNYDFPDNTLSTSMANMLKSLDPTIKANCFHNGSSSFYNRNVYELAAGFEHFYAYEEMTKMGMYNWMDEYGERNLDSKMIETCADLMFPTNERFYTYIISITQHGQYKHRKNLEDSGYYDTLEKYGLVENGNEFHDSYVTYVAATMELDKAIGKINEELEQRGLKDNTIITLYGDHNCYYSGLSGYIKNIDSYSQCESEGINYVDLYNVPLMIHVPGMEHQVINKFMATCDIVPTLYDLLGINYYKNVFYGNSAFEEEESVLYSRAYNFFCTSDLYFTSLNRVKFRNGTATMTEDVISRTKKLVKKIEYADRIFYNDYFGKTVLDRSILSQSESNILTYGDLYNLRLNKINVQ